MGAVIASDIHLNFHPTSLIYSAGYRHLPKWAACPFIGTFCKVSGIALAWEVWIPMTLMTVVGCPVWLEMNFSGCLRSGFGF